MEGFNRRKMLRLIFTVPFVTFFYSFLGCKPSRSSRTQRLVDLGRPESFEDGVTLLPVKRLAVVRQAEAFFAMSAVCTHMPCSLKHSGDKFLCPCHGSSFDMSGEVLTGPAKKQLDFFKISKSKSGNLQVDLAEVVGPDYRFNLNL